MAENADGVVVTVFLPEAGVGDGIGELAINKQFPRSAVLERRAVVLMVEPQAIDDEAIKAMEVGGLYSGV